MSKVVLSKYFCNNVVNVIERLLETKYYCYILKNSYLPHKNRTYIGYTINPSRRIRQHNQEISGGAKYTSAFGNKSWYIYCLISGFPDNITALQCEWRLKHPCKKKKLMKKFYGPIGRIKGLNEDLKLKQWTSKSVFENNMYDIHIQIKEEYADLLTEVPENVKVTTFTNYI